MRVVCIIVLLNISTILCAQPGQSASLANSFLSSLTGEQKSKTVFPLDNEERFNWHYVPKSRKGIALRELSDEQKTRALDLLKSCLSPKGFAKTIDIIELEKVLKVLENQPDDEYRNSGKYYLSIFGKPDDKNAWGWRFEGHHISFNFSSIRNILTSGTPGFLGSNPAIVPSGPQQGKQVLKEETDAGFALIQSFNESQVQNALTKASPRDIITGASRKAILESNEGIPYSAMTKDQQALFMNVIHIYVHRYTKLFADNMIREITEAGLNNLRFVWSGSQKADGKPYYYRIQGPTIIIEYENSQNNTNHIHTVVRDLKHDFGGDEMLEHYKASHSGRG